MKKIMMQNHKEQYRKHINLKYQDNKFNLTFEFSFFINIILFKFSN